MFEQVKLLGPTERSIIVQTRRGTDVKNLVELDPGPREQRVYEQYLQKFGRNWVRRRPPVGVYNCAGHVWASRRTAILESGEVLHYVHDVPYGRQGFEFRVEYWTDRPA